MLRSTYHSSSGLAIAQWTVDHFSATQQLVRAAITILKLKCKLVGTKTLTSFSKSLSQLMGNRLPQWNPELPNASPRIRHYSFGKGRTVVYYPSCINRVFSATSGRVSLMNIMAEIADESGIRLIIPKDIDNSCCGTPYQSKGYEVAYKRMLEKTINLLYEVSNNGEYPIVVDTSPCTYQLLHCAESLTPLIHEKWSRLTFQDITPFLWEIVKDSRKEPLPRSVLLHVTCSTRKLGQGALMHQVAEVCAKDVILPTVEDCCAFAGDRGLLFPELTTSATKRLAGELKEHESTIIGYSTSRMCEVGLQSATYLTYVSLAYLVRDYLYS
jgi:D-lactate dehydrogenase